MFKKLLVFMWFLPEKEDDSIIQKLEEDYNAMKEDEQKRKYQQWIYDIERYYNTIRERRIEILLRRNYREWHKRIFTTK